MHGCTETSHRRPSAALRPLPVVALCLACPTTAGELFARTHARRRSLPIKPAQTVPGPRLKQPRALWFRHVVDVDVRCGTMKTHGCSNGYRPVPSCDRGIKVDGRASGQHRRFGYQAACRGGGRGCALGSVPFGLEKFGQGMIVRTPVRYLGGGGGGGVSDMYRVCARIPSECWRG
ncbi:hypothetical protein BC835DRAFT_1085821 [Cytidiella melzeri]|nr:hypothetical protein BC835DRAFT_1085821 [Cytidiella melzeri]